MTMLRTSIPTNAGRDDAVTSVSCAHCGLDVPAARHRDEDNEQFCCDGCRAVYVAIHGCGLEAYYRMRDRFESSVEPARIDTAGVETWDNSAFQDRWCTARDDGTMTCQLRVAGMHCAACVWLLERLPTIIPGLTTCRVEFGRQRLQLTWSPAVTSLSAIVRRIHAFGYRVHPASTSDEADGRSEDKRALVRIGVAGAIAGNVMVIAFALYGGTFHGMEAGLWTFFRYASLALTLVSMAWPGRVFLHGAWAAIRTGTPHIDVPIAIGLTAGTVSGLINTVRGTGDVYFESVTVLIFLLLIGRWLQARQQRQSRDALALLFSMTPATARRLDSDGSGATQTVPVDALAVDECIDVRPGECVPADGVVIDGTSMVDRALLSGESTPVPVVPGEHVFAGVTNCSQRLVIRISATGESTRISRLMQLVERAANERAPVVELTHRLAGAFVFLVLMLAACTAALWTWLEPGVALERSMALLVVTCPCALGLATPLALVVSIGRAARRGMLVKGGSALQSLDGVGTIYFDKTGTLTTGSLHVVDWFGAEDLRLAAALAERESMHPIAAALREHVDLPDEHASDAPTAVVRETFGGGVIARIDDHEIMVGSARFHVEHDCVGVDDFDAPATRARADGATVVFIARDRQVAAMAVIADTVRDESRSVVDRLRTRGWRIGVLSGDHPDVVTALTRRLDLDPSACHGGMAPEQKLEVVRREATNGTVVMVGDGVNDAAALASATVGIAVQGSAEASLTAADVYLAGGGLHSLMLLMDGARRTMIVIRRNLAFSLGYNVIGATLAITGVINPLIAAVLMPLSSLTVVGLSFRSRLFPRQTGGEAS